MKDSNFSLLSYVADLNVEVDKTEAQIAALTEELARYKGSGASAANARRHTLEVRPSYSKTFAGGCETDRDTVPFCCCGSILRSVICARLTKSRAGTDLEPARAVLAGAALAFPGDSTSAKALRTREC